MTLAIVVGIAGAIGAAARYLLDGAVQDRPVRGVFHGQGVQLGQVLDVHVALQGAAASPVSGATGRPCPFDQRGEVGVATASVDEAGPHHDAAPTSVGENGVLGLDASRHRVAETGDQ